MSIEKEQSLTYKNSGVDIDAGNDLVQRIAPFAQATARAGVVGQVGGFGGLFDLKAEGFKDPILVSGTDGVGTKLKIAIETDHHATIGIDLVAMCVNDVLVQGAQPLFFLDYFATGKLDVSVAEDVIQGIAKGCNLAGAALLGGETAEMPDFYPDKHYDLAGFCVGAAERDNILPRKDDIRAGDIIIGLPSSGFHANGFSLIRKIVAQTGLNYNDPAPWDKDISLGEGLLTPTRIYVDEILPVLKGGKIKALCHITGGGFTENLPRILPDTLSCEIDLEAYSMADIFSWVQKSAKLPDSEMLKTFNCGIGMVLIVAIEDVDTILAAFSDVVKIGIITENTAQKVSYKGRLQGEAQ